MTGTRYSALAASGEWSLWRMDYDIACGHYDMKPGEESVGEQAKSSAFIGTVPDVR
jgi:hypothetical protein